MLSRSSAFALVALSLSTLANAGAARGSEKRTSTSQPGQQGYNDCGTTNSQTSECQTAVVNSVTDFCLWAPPTYGPTIGDSEEYEVAWCTQDGHGTRTMPAGTIQSAHYLVTPHYTQVTGTGDFTKINILAGDSGGELDPHGADGNGNPIGALVYNNGVAIQEWTSFISDTEFCLALVPDGSGFDQCEGDSTEYPPGIYVENGVTSTYQQGDGSNPAPTAHAAGASSNCQAVATVGGGVAM
ncbi:hypothetical protein MNV49_004729 [Pseudohyphozyma bogoriensis]|nr:hypothetical protein MNV49_004729 [Pseudohyphozyma bogoriensis]